MSQTYNSQKAFETKYPLFRDPKWVPVFCNFPPLIIIYNWFLDHQSIGPPWPWIGQLKEEENYLKFVPHDNSQRIGYRVTIE